MRTNYEIRYAAHPEDAKSYDTKRIRRDFLIEKSILPERSEYGIFHVRPYGGRWCHAGG